MKEFPFKKMILPFVYTFEQPTFNRNGSYIAIIGRGPVVPTAYTLIVQFTDPDNDIPLQYEVKFSPTTQTRDTASTKTCRGPEWKKDIWHQVPHEPNTSFHLKFKLTFTAKRTRPTTEITFLTTKGRARSYVELGPMDYNYRGIAKFVVTMGPDPSIQVQAQAATPLVYDVVYGGETLATCPTNQVIL
uniref:Galectin n=1 Tax=Romanomermis culicivorax TaxID=13658 RepID=A0A915J8B9_ROMCU